jgi:hypothetical protein
MTEKINTSKLTSKQIENLIKKSRDLEEALVKILRTSEGWQRIMQMADAKTEFDEDINFAQKTLAKYAESFDEARNSVDYVIAGPILSGSKKEWYVMQNSGCYFVRCYSDKKIIQEYTIDKALESNNLIPESLREKVKECFEISQVGMCFPTQWQGEKHFYFSTYDGHVSESFDNEELAIRTMMERHSKIPQPESQSCK